MFIFIWAPCHTRLSLRRVIKITPTICKCLQKHSLTSPGQSAEIKGHVCPSFCLFVSRNFVLFFNFFKVICLSMNRYWKAELCWTRSESANYIFTPKFKFFFFFQLFQIFSLLLNHSVGNWLGNANMYSFRKNKVIAFCQLFKNTQANLYLRRLILKWALNCFQPITVY